MCLTVPVKSTEHRRGQNVRVSVLSERLRQAMKEAIPSLSQADLARAAAVSRASVTDWLNGQTKTIKGGNLLRVSEALGVSPKWLAEGVGPMRPPQRMSATRQIVTAIAGDFGEPPQTQEEADLLEAWRAWGDEIRGHVRRLMIDTALRGHPVLDAANTGSRVDQERFNAHIETAQRKARAKAPAKKAAPVKRPRTPRP